MAYSVTCKQELQHALNSILPQLRHGRVGSFPLGAQQHFQIAVMPQAGHHVGRLTDNGPGKAVFPNQRLWRRCCPPLRPPPGQGLQAGKSLLSASTVKASIIAAQPAFISAVPVRRWYPLFAEAIVLKVVGGDGIQMPDKAKVYLISLLGEHYQVKAVFIDFLFDYTPAVLFQVCLGISTVSSSLPEGLYMSTRSLRRLFSLSGCTSQTGQDCFYFLLHLVCSFASL